MNRWRYVTGADDGCDIFQCLKCKGKWETRTPPATFRESLGHTFCGWCGTKWKGEHKWGYDHMEHFAWMRPILVPLWDVQYRLMWKEKDGFHSVMKDPTDLNTDGWKRETLVICNAIQAMMSLNYYRTQYPYEAKSPVIREYRIQVVKSSDPAWESLAGEASNYYTSDEADYRYHDDYRTEWGGKQHRSMLQRRWFIPEQS